LTLEGFSGDGVCGLGSGEVALCLDLGVVLGAVGGDEQAVSLLLECRDVYLEDLSRDASLLLGLAGGEGVDCAFSGSLPVVEELLEAVDLVTSSL